LHFNPIILVRAEYLDEAKDKAMDFCERESEDSSSMDFLDIMPDEKTDFNKPLSLVKDKLPADDYAQVAREFVKKGNLLLEENNDDKAGRCFERAGSLLQQEFCPDTVVFNAETYNYSRKCDGDGWYAIEVIIDF